MFEYGIPLMLTENKRGEKYCERMDAVKKYIRNHVDEPLTRDYLAHRAGYSVPQLHRVFKAYEGESIASYVRRVRLKRAGQKLRMVTRDHANCPSSRVVRDRVSAVDITEVALAAGYQTHAAFAKAFKKQYGYCPSEFRSLDCWTATEILRRD